MLYKCNKRQSGHMGGRVRWDEQAQDFHSHAKTEVIGESFSLTQRTLTISHITYITLF